jgi:hypothetical protein
VGKTQLKDPPKLYYDAVCLANAFKKKGTVETHFAWKDLGIQVGVCFGGSLPPNVHFLNGPLECVCLTVDDDKEENEVVRGLNKEFIDCEMVEAGDRDSDRNKDSDYLDDVIDDDGSGTEESLDDCVEEKVVVREKKRKRTGGEGGRKNTPSIERAAANKEGRKVEETDNIELLVKGKVATVRDLVTRERKNIKVDGTSYSSGIAIETRCNKKIIEYREVYRCLMVMNRRNKKEGWRILASHRDSSNKDYVGVRGGWRASF